MDCTHALNPEEAMNQVCSRVQQRYLLVVMCLLGFMFSTMNHFSFDLMVQEMFYSTKERSYTPPCTEAAERSRSAGKEELLWGKTLQNQVIASWLYGKLLGRLPLALLTDKFGAKTIFGFSIFIPGICSAITPLCARTSPFIMIGVRIINSFFGSTQSLTQAWMAARWFPARTRGFMLSIVCMGHPLGLVLTLWFNHFCVHSTNMRWGAVCYLNGCLSVVFAYIWQLLVCDDPFQHPYVTDDELVLLATQVPMYAQEAELQPGWKWPWKYILKSRYLWLFSIAFVGDEFSFSFATYTIPLVYFPDVQVYDLSRNEGTGTLVFLSMAAGMILGGIVGDCVVSCHRWLSITTLTSIYFTCSCILSSLIHIAVVHSECDLNRAIASYLAAMFCQGFSFTNWTNACLHIAPNFVATTMALISLPQIILSPVFYILNDHVLNLPIRDSWLTAAYLNAIISVSTTAIFLKFGKVEQELWNEPHKIKEEDDDDDSESLGEDTSEDFPSKTPTQTPNLPKTTRGSQEIKDD